MDFKKEILKPIKLKLFFLKRMPLGYFAGLKVEQFNKESATVSLPFNWITKNPFKSVYFGAQAMAAELSTGIIAMNAVLNSKKSISMLVFAMEANFVKKATSKVNFECIQVKEVEQAIQKCIETGEGVIVKSKSVGTDEVGDVVSEFYFTWTFKLKTK